MGYYLKSISGILFSGVCFLFGTPDNLFSVLVCFIVIDYITGICAGIYTKTLSSHKGAKGIMKKMVILSVVALSHMADLITGTEILRNAAIGFYIANEGLSILENAARTGVKLPKKLIDVLEQLKSE